MNLAFRAFGGIAVVFLFFEVVRAERVYQLVDYPAIQNGYSLSGTITTTDAAPVDGSLTLEEIVDWQFSATGQGNSIHGVLGLNPIRPSWPVTAIKNIAISSETIELRPVSEPAFELFSLLDLSDYVSPGAPNLNWSTFDGPNPRIPSTFVRIEAFFVDPELGGFQLPWLSEMNVGVSGWVVATYVPEPTSGLMMSFAICSAILSRISFS